jgi:restriction endonuclease Mrr
LRSRTQKRPVQVKSFTGQHWETNAVEQIKDALNEFEAAMGLIITTAESTKNLEEAIEALSNELKKPIGLIAGEEVARFVLKYGGALIL